MGSLVSTLNSSFADRSLTFSKYKLHSRVYCTILCVADDDAKTSGSLSYIHLTMRMESIIDGRVLFAELKPRAKVLSEMQFEMHLTAFAR